MSRRDTIIIAVLVNAGLLAVLFLMAINSDDDKINETLDVTHSIVEVNIPESSKSSITAAFPQDVAEENDEVDSVIKDFASNDPSQQIVQDEEITQEIELDNDSEISQTPVAVEQTPTKETNASYVEVKVKRGDSLDKIARANKTSIKAIKDTNQLKGEKLQIGQVLRIPSKSEQKVKTPTSAATAKPIVDNKPVALNDQQYYTVKSGDNPWKIAKQFKMKVDDLLKLNGLSEEKARNLKIGDKIRVK